MRTLDEIRRDWFTRKFLPANTIPMYPSEVQVLEGILEVLADIREVIKTNNLLLMDLRDKK